MAYLGETITELPDHELPSKRQVLQLLHGMFGDEDGVLNGFQGWEQASVHCPRKPSGDFRCSDPDGCVAQRAFCYFFKLKAVWVKARLPTVLDKSALQKLRTLQTSFIKQCRKKYSESYEAELGKTLDLAPRNYTVIVMESDDEEQEKLRKIRILDDFVGPAASRLVHKKYISISVPCEFIIT